MRKLLIFLGLAIVVIFAIMTALRLYTKSHSPEDIAEYKSDNIEIRINYCQPYKNGRVIFGELIPYGEVWRTGANEATTITTQSDIYVQGNLLPAGTYTLWTLPNEKEWQIIFNTEYGQWGVNFSDGKANRDVSQDHLIVTVPSYPHKKVIEQFTIQFEKMDDEIEMIMMWDNTVVVVPFTTQP